MKIVDTILSFPLFRGLPTSVIKTLRIPDDVEESYHAAGTFLPSPGLCVSCILSGRVEVQSNDTERPFTLRYLTSGEQFGAASVFSESETPISRIYFLKDTVLLRVKRNAIRIFLETSPSFSEKYIEFLSERIRFLNRRIACISAGSAERKLGIWLCSVSGSDELDLSIRMTALADVLNLGRASLYRAFDGLTEKGWIVRNGNQIQICNRFALLNETY